jgi:L,D-transpeptidase YbiS
MRRYIYLHGTPEETPLGQPGSHGCVRMANRDIIELFELVDAGIEVDIHE